MDWIEPRSRVRALFFSFTAIQFALGTVMLTFKGAAVDLMVARPAGPESILWAVGAFSCLHVLGILLNTVSENLRRFASIDQFNKVWKKHFPSRVYSHEVSSFERHYLGFVSHIPRIFELRIAEVCHYATLSTVLGVYLYKTLIDRFWLGLAFLPLLTGLSLLAGRLYVNRLSEGVFRSNEEKGKLLKWVQSFFRANREIYLSWGGADSAVTERSEFRSWIHSKGNAFASAERCLARIILRKNILSNLLVELPYVLCVGGIMVSAAWGWLTIADAFVWFGITEYLVQANNSLRQIKPIRAEVGALKSLLRKELPRFGSVVPDGTGKPGSEMLSELRGVSNATRAMGRFELTDQTLVELSLEPGFYSIAGKNGSGKSTLLDVLAGANLIDRYWDPDLVAEFRASLGTRLRWIERDPVLFSDCQSFSQQIMGLLPAGESKAPSSADVMGRLVENTSQVLSSELVAEWARLWGDLERRYLERRDGGLSSGEKVCLSVARAFSRWEAGMKAIICDECDTFLDQGTRTLLMRTLRELSRKMAVFFVSHHGVSPRIEVGDDQAWLTSVQLLACDSSGKKGIMIPLRVSAVLDGTGKCTGAGNIGSALAGVAEMVRSAMILTHPRYQRLRSADLVIEGSYPGVQVGQTESSGLAIAIALVNLVRSSKGMPAVQGMAATGQVLLDGRIEEVRAITAKLNEARKRVHDLKRVLTPADLSHLSELEAKLEAKAAV